MQVVYHGYMNYTGYSIAAQEYILSMLYHQPDLNIRLLPLSNIAKGGVSENRYQMFQALRTRTPEEKDTIHIYHSIPQLYRRPRGSVKNIGVCLFETFNIPKEWVKNMNEMDSIITASEFNKNTFQAHGVEKPIYVVPHCFDTHMFNHEVRPTGRYKMKTIIAVGTWKQRKNWDRLIKGFYDAFEQKDNVCLLIKTDKRKELDRAVLSIKRSTEWRSKDTAPVYAEEKTNCDFEEIPRIMRKGDVYISASLGEGFGLPGMHAMALGMPVITTRFGGALEYAKPQFCTYLEPNRNYKRLPMMDGIPQFRDCIWPMLRIGEIRDKLREVVFDKNQIVRQKSAMAYDFVHKNFNYNIIGKKFLEAVFA